MQFESYIKTLTFETLFDSVKWCQEAFALRIREEQHLERMRVVYGDSTASHQPSNILRNKEKTLLSTTPKSLK